jgi:hypothetical protein
MAEAVMRYAVVICEEAILQRRLNARAKKGWRLVKAVRVEGEYGDGTWHCIFERES